MLEMSCVLIVMSILASCIIPVLTRTFLERAADKAALDMSCIEEGARAYFISSGGWPSSISALQSAGYLPSTWNALNPFGHLYMTSNNGSTFTVSTQVMDGSQISISSRLPVSSIAGTTVSSTIPPPGASTTGFGPKASIVIGRSYLAATDGIVEVKATISTLGGGTQVSGFTDSSSNPTTLCGALSVIFPGSGQSDHTVPESSFSMSVRQGDHYLVTRGPVINSGSTSDTANVSAYFRPMGV